MSPFSLHTRLAAVLLALCATATAQQPAGPPEQTGSQPSPQTISQPTPQSAQQNGLYLDAMRSMSEGRQQDASEALLRMIEQEPQHAGAWLDLAIIQCELGRAQEAERLFATIESRFEPPPAIREVIRMQRAKGCLGWQPRSRLMLSAGRGSDSNVNQGASIPNFTIGPANARIELQLLPEYLPQRDQYTQLSAEYLRELRPDGSLGFLQLRVQRNDQLSRYDTSSAVAGVERPWRLGDWTVHGTGLLALHALGGRLYQTQTQAQARLTPPLALPAGWQVSAVGGLSHLKYHTLEEFDSLASELRGLLAWRRDDSQALATIGYAHDRASGARPGGDRAGWLASVSARTRLAGRAHGEASWSLQRWTSDTPYSPGFIDQIRDQDTRVLRGLVSFAIAPRQSLNIELRQVKNDENISLFKYNSRQLQLSWQWQTF